MKKDLNDKIFEEIKRRGLFEDDDDDDDDEDEDYDDDEDDEDEDDEDEDEDENINDSNDDFCEMVCKLLNSQHQAHVFHFAVTGKGSYAAHKALQTYYESIDGLVDGLVESYQGKYGLLKNYKSYRIENFKNIKKTISYFDRLLDDVENLRESVEESFLQNQIDTIEELINTTLYKLKFLND